MNRRVTTTARGCYAAFAIVASGCAQLESGMPAQAALSTWLRDALMPAKSTTASPSPVAQAAPPQPTAAAATSARPEPPAKPAGGPQSAASNARKGGDTNQVAAVPVETTGTASPSNTLVATTASANARDELQNAPGTRNGRRFSVVLTGAAPEVVFMALLADTPLSVAVDPAVKGPMAISLKDVTLREALDLLRELHNLEYKVIGRHILVSPAQMQTRIFTIDYPSFNRAGRSDTKVLSGSISAGSGGSGSSAGGNNGGNGNTGSGGSVQGGGNQESSRITTSQRNDLWSEVEGTIKLLVGDKEGRSVIVSPQTGNIVVRALPREMRAVQQYLESTRASIERQVMLEAKVVEVQLRDSERTGINWGAFKAGLSARVSAGLVAPGASLATTGAIAGGLINVTPGATLVNAATNVGSVLGLAFQTSNFASVLEFLATQGNTQVLSSPRIATMNNQKALLKVGTDDFFVTNISTTGSTGNNSSNSGSNVGPNISVQPFFSGISLDVTPSITSDGFITLHIHPAVSNVTERNKVLNLGALGTYSLPLASSDINETDAVVRAKDGQIIAIGGLMRQASINSDSGLPGAAGTIFRKLMGGETVRMTEKRELVILLKPTIIDPSQDDEHTRDTLQRLLDWTESMAANTKPGKAALAAPAATPAPAAAAGPAGTPAAPEVPPAAAPAHPPAAAPATTPTAAPTAAATASRAVTPIATPAAAPTMAAPAAASSAPSSPVQAQAASGPDLGAAIAASVALAAEPAPLVAAVDRR